jgi:hypothetical protein
MRDKTIQAAFVARIRQPNLKQIALHMRIVHARKALPRGNALFAV